MWSYIWQETDGIRLFANHIAEQRALVRVRLHGNGTTTSHLARLLETCEDLLNCAACGRMRPGAHIGFYCLWREIPVYKVVQDVSS